MHIKLFIVKNSHLLKGLGYYSYKINNRFKDLRETHSVTTSVAEQSL